MLQKENGYRYDEFGTDFLGNQGQLQSFGYTGYQRDAVAGIYYAQAREYDAWSGRFTGEEVIFGAVNDAVGFVADDVAVASACITLVAILGDKIDKLFKNKEECES